MSMHVQSFHDRMRSAAASRADNLDDALRDRRTDRLAESCMVAKAHGIHEVILDNRRTR